LLKLNVLAAHSSVSIIKNVCIAALKIPITCPDTPDKWIHSKKLSLRQTEYNFHETLIVEVRSLDISMEQEPGRLKEHHPEESKDVRRDLVMKARVT
jgi:hypothetical protein